MNKYIYIIALFLICTTAFCQQEKSIIYMSPGPGGFIESKTPGRDKLQAEFYLNEMWYQGDVIANGRSLVKNKPLKIDLMNNTVEVKQENGIGYMFLSYVDTITWVGSVLGDEEIFINSEKYALRSPSLIKVLHHKGNGAIYKYITTRIKKSDYNPAFDVGDRTDKIIKQEDLYYSINGEFIQLLPQKKKDFIKIFGKKSSQVKDYIRSNNLSTKEISDIINIFTFWDTL